MEVNGDAPSATAVRSHRPESSASARLKFSPQCSSSSTSAPYRNLGDVRNRERVQDNDRGGSTGAIFLQELLREKKAARLVEKRRSMDLESSASVRNGPQVSPVRNISSSRSGREKDGGPSSGGERAAGRKPMGVKEMEETVSSLHKHNFDLKLELFHRRQKQLDLETRLEEVESRLADQVEMQAINEQLLMELEKRDQAVEEAVGIICSLEERIERLMEEQSTIRSSDSLRQLDDVTGNDGEYIQDLGSLRPQSTNRDQETPLKPIRLGSTPRPVPKMPSFLSEKSEGTEALRSLYLPSDHSQSLLNLPKLQEESTANEPSEGEMNSPRLSVLSESSFLSVYGEKNLAIEGLDLNHGVEADSSSPQQNHRSDSVEKWVEERKIPVPAPKQPLSRIGKIREKRFISLNDVLESPLQRLEKLHRTLVTKSRRQLISTHIHEVSVAECRDISGKPVKDKPRDKLKTAGLASYERQQGLPPTPDTISTSTLRHFQVSNDALGRDIAERGNGRERRLGRCHSVSYSPDECIRRSGTEETVTSCREGHGWDTVTQSEATETGSEFDVEAPTSIDPWIAMARERSRQLKLQPPDMFTFSAEDDEEWARHRTFNPDKKFQSSRQKRFGQGDGADEDPCDNRFLPYQQSNSAHEESQGSQYQTLGSSFDNKQSPQPPVRRSSLAISPTLNDKKSRKVTPSITTSRPNRARKHQAQSGTKFSGITKLFGLGKSESSDSSSPAITPKATTYVPSSEATRGQTHGGLTRSKFKGHVANPVTKDSHRTSATPPPIYRYRRGSTGNNGDKINPRPMTANSVDSRLPIRRSSIDGNDRELYGFGFGADGTGDERDREGKEGGVGRKWFTIGRNASLRH